MLESNPVCNPIVPGTKVDRDARGKLVNETQYKPIVGSLMYLTSTRPDIMFVTSLISRYMSRPIELHLQLEKRILRYLKGTTEYGLFYKEGTSKGGLLAYTDNDYADDHEDRKSTSGYVFLLSLGAVTWSMEFKEATNSDTVNHRGRICSSYGLHLSSHLDDENSQGTKS
ncbi:hypothetical protein LIER_30998 [Lithospermum erythrorhizon]|uniref:Retrovirus-related Pol polyprotein from transposon RE1 n=1 Tax=Lithospermum erythrorhizon TaxID=34254 RepID=A0AAV3RT44_LITER